MQLTLYTDYSLRVLIYLAFKGEELSTIDEISKAYRISKHHLTRVVHKLGENGSIKTIRGKGGGICLAQKPKDINIGRIVKEMEKNFDLVECFNKDKNQCILSPMCGLKNILYEAKLNFLKTLESKTLADILVDKNSFNKKA
ncbi:Rrf2 family transcriptional regulator [Fluviispira multicolorata]|uniref:Rrf2 family transcriptional regulator n=1 Tax=Fluviispira multicolorata TaxID=2654512 RepID=A0A833JBU0_9BACT|nr:Rrf2 family transcriptional regulator [Fluviispira multicolorata]KAB8028529.1 Rrf2 family transcriptional regulator [Fluviispira multicolorata]